MQRGHIHLPPPPLAVRINGDTWDMLYLINPEVASTLRRDLNHFLPLVTVAWGQHGLRGMWPFREGVKGWEGVGICQRDMQPTGGQFRREDHESSSVPRHL